MKYYNESRGTEIHLQGCISLGQAQGITTFLQVCYAVSSSAMLGIQAVSKTAFPRANLPHFSFPLPIHSFTLFLSFRHSEILEIYW